MSRLRDAARAETGTIAVTVTFFADLRRFLPRGADGPQRYSVAEGATLADLLAAVGIEAGAEVTAAVNGELVDRDTRLRDGADVMLLSPMEGGAAAEGEATISMQGGAAAEGEATISMQGGAAAEGEATISMEGGGPAEGPVSMDGA